MNQLYRILIDYIDGYSQTTHWIENFCMQIKHTFFNNVIRKLRFSNHLRSISLVIVLLFSLEQISFAAPNVFADKSVSNAFKILPQSPITHTLSDLLEQPSKIQIPFNYAQVQELHQGTNGKLIINIQDAHANTSGQMHLAKTLDELMTRYGIKLVLAEGGEGDASLSTLRGRMSKRDMGMAAHRLLLDGVIAGHEYLDLTSEHNMQLIGIEDKDLYFKNLSAYKDLTTNRNNIQKHFHRIQISTNRLKNKFYPEEILSYEQLEDFNTKFIRLLELTSDKSALSLYPEIQKFYELKKSEDSINFDLLNQEKESLFRSLSSKGQSKQIEVLTQTKDKQTHTQLSQTFFIQRLFELAEEYQIPTDSLAELKKYRDYLQQFQELQFNVLMEEMEAFERLIYKTSFKGEEDPSILRAIDQFVGLLDKAYNIQMSSQEYQTFLNNEVQFQDEAWQAFLNEKLLELEYYEDIIPFKKELSDAKQTLKTFYNLVDQRDQAFIQNIQKALNQANEKAAFLVAGGYHTQHLNQLLREQGYSYITLTPIVTSETDHQKYEKLLLQELDNSVIKQEHKAANQSNPKSKQDKLVQILSRLSQVRISRYVQTHPNTLSGQAAGMISGLQDVTRLPDQSIVTRTDMSLISNSVNSGNARAYPLSATRLADKEAPTSISIEGSRFAKAKMPWEAAAILFATGFAPALFMQSVFGLWDWTFGVLAVLYIILHEIDRSGSWLNLNSLNPKIYKFSFLDIGIYSAGVLVGFMIDFLNQAARLSNQNLLSRARDTYSKLISELSPNSRFNVNSQNQRIYKFSLQDIQLYLAGAFIGFVSGLLTEAARLSNQSSLPPIRDNDSKLISELSPNFEAARMTNDGDRLHDWELFDNWVDEFRGAIVDSDDFRDTRYADIFGKIESIVDTMNDGVMQGMANDLYRISFDVMQGAHPSFLLEPHEIVWEQGEIVYSINAEYVLEAMMMYVLTTSIQYEIPEAVWRNMEDLILRFNRRGFGKTDLNLASLYNLTRAPLFRRLADKFEVLADQITALPELDQGPANALSAFSGGLHRHGTSKDSEHDFRRHLNEIEYITRELQINSKWSQSDREQMIIGLIRLLVFLMPYFERGVFVDSDGIERDNFVIVALDGTPITMPEDITNRYRALVYPILNKFEVWIKEVFPAHRMKGRTQVSDGQYHAYDPFISGGTWFIYSQAKNIIFKDMDRISQTLDKLFTDRKDPTSEAFIDELLSKPYTVDERYGIYFHYDYEVGVKRWDLFLEVVDELINAQNRDTLPADGARLASPQAPRMTPMWNRFEDVQWKPGEVSLDDYYLRLANENGIPSELISHAINLPSVEYLDDYREFVRNEIKVLRSDVFKELNLDQREILIRIRASAVGLYKSNFKKHVSEGYVVERRNLWSERIVKLANSLDTYPAFSSRKRVYLLADMVNPAVLIEATLGSEESDYELVYLGRNSMPDVHSKEESRSMRKENKGFYANLVRTIQEYKAEYQSGFSSELDAIDTEAGYKSFEQDIINYLIVDQRMEQEGSIANEIAIGFLKQLRSAGLIDESNALIQPIVLIDGPQYQSMLLLAKAILIYGNASNRDHVNTFALASSVSKFNTLYPSESTEAESNFLADHPYEFIIDGADPDTKIENPKFKLRDHIPSVIARGYATLHESQLIDMEVEALGEAESTNITPNPPNDTFPRMTDLKQELMDLVGGIASFYDYYTGENVLESFDAAQQALTKYRDQAKDVMAGIDSTPNVSSAFRRYSQFISELVEDSLKRLNGDIKIHHDNARVKVANEKMIQTISRFFRTHRTFVKTHLSDPEVMEEVNKLIDNIASIIEESGSVINRGIQLKDGQRRLEELQLDINEINGLDNTRVDQITRIAQTLAKAHALEEDIFRINVQNQWVSEADRFKTLQEILAQTPVFENKNPKDDSPSGKPARLASPQAPRMTDLKQELMDLANGISTFYDYFKDENALENFEIARSALAKYRIQAKGLMTTINFTLNVTSAFKQYSQLINEFVEAHFVLLNKHMETHHLIADLRQQNEGLVEWFQTLTVNTQVATSADQPEDNGVDENVVAEISDQLIDSFEGLISIANNKYDLLLIGVNHFNVNLGIFRSRIDSLGDHLSLMRESHVAAAAAADHQQIISAAYAALHELIEDLVRAAVKNEWADSAISFVRLKSMLVDTQVFRGDEAEDGPSQDSPARLAPRAINNIADKPELMKQILLSEDFELPVRGMLLPEMKSLFVRWLGKVRVIDNTYAIGQGDKTFAKVRIYSLGKKGYRVLDDRTGQRFAISLAEIEAYKLQITGNQMSSEVVLQQLNDDSFSLDALELKASVRRALALFREGMRVLNALTKEAIVPFRMVTDFASIRLSLGQNLKYLYAMQGDSRFQGTASHIFIGSEADRLALRQYQDTVKGNAGFVAFVKQLEVVSLNQLIKNYDVNRDPRLVFAGTSRNYAGAYQSNLDFKRLVDMDLVSIAPTKPASRNELLDLLNLFNTSAILAQWSQLTRDQKAAGDSLMQRYFKHAYHIDGTRTQIDALAHASGIESDLEWYHRISLPALGQFVDAIFANLSHSIRNAVNASA